MRPISGLWSRATATTPSAHRRPGPRRPQRRHLRSFAGGPGARWSLFAAASAAVRPSPAWGSGGITDDEKLIHLEGHWHWGQRKRVQFESACYYTHEPELPNGCQYDVSRHDAWRAAPRRGAERSALMALFVATGGGHWRANENWHAENDPCWDSWYGVTCDEHGHVINLELSDNGLRGELPDLSALESLLKLDLSTSASEHHAHPNAFRNLLTGALPPLARATRLEEIEISGNEFSEWPEDLYVNGKTLRVLSASHNLFATFPQHLRRFTKLHTLELGHNMIATEIPSEIGYLANARFVHLEYNLLRGAIPNNIKRMTRNRVLDLSHNPGLGGELPSELVVQWTNQDWLSVLNTSVGGYLSSLCIDVPLCWKFMYDTHPDLTWATSADVPDVVANTVELARTGR